MANLSSFKEETGSSLESFKIEQEAPVISNRASSKNFAATVAMMEEDPERVMTTYNSTLAELDGDGSSKTSEDVLNKAKASELGAIKSSVLDFLADPEISDDVKLATTTQMLDATNEHFNARNVLSNKALSLESGDENFAQEAVRVDIAGAINEVNAYKKRTQAILNREVAKSNINTGKALMDIMGFIAPYAEQARVADIVTEFNAEVDGGGNGASLVAEAITFMGSSKADMKEYMNKMPPAERIGMVESLVEIINSHDGIVLSDENDFARVEFLRTFLEDGYYNDFDEFVDNVVSLLDTTALGGVAARILGRPAQAIRRALDSTPEVIDADIARAYAKGGAQPSSVAANMKDVNPEKARAVHNLAQQDETGEAAASLYGTTREEAIASDILPEVASASGRVENKVHNPGKDFDQELTVDADLMDFVNRDGAIYLWEEEKRKIRGNVYNDFTSAEGITLRSESSQIGTSTAGGAKISAIYGNTEGGFRTAEEALEKTKVGLRDFGVKDSEITILKRDNTGGYTELSKFPAGPEKLEGDFVARVDYDYKFNPFDFDEMSKFDVKWNIFDRIQQGAPKGGTLQRHILDIHSMLNKEATLGANVAVDKAAGMERAMLELGKKFTDTFTKLPSNRQALVEQYIKEANHKGLKFDINRLVADGYKPAEIQAIKNWRTYWDTVYWAENRDLGLTLRHRGYKLLEDAGTNTRLFAKPMQESAVKGGIKAYDYRTGNLVDVTPDELAEIYKNGGEVGKLRNPVDVEGEIGEYIISENKASGKYLRAIRDNDQVLNYREGYYQVAYTAPKYIVKRVKDKNGKVLYDKAIAVAGNTADATKRAKWHADSEGKRFDPDDATADYFVREDVKGEGLASDDYWNTQVSAGRSAQKVRGDRLEEASSTLQGAGEQFIMSPVDSMINSARSVSRRVPMRNYIETMKTRFMQQYGDVLPKNDFGQPIFPNNRESLVKAGEGRNKKLADARTVWEYINYLEGGYINSIDEGMKSTMKLLGDLFAKAGMSKAESVALKASDNVGITGFAKNSAFQLYLALNPARQFIIQSHQAALLTANFPEYVVKGTMARDLSGIITMNLHGNAKMAAKVSGRSEKEIAEMFKEFQRSGLAASVDKQNLIRGSLTEIADSKRYKGKVAPVSGAVNISRRMGFDSGEYINIATSWLAHRDKMVKSGRTMDDAALEEVSGLARNYTYNMNAAGDMPYNQNALGIIFQFMQVPHKAITQVAFNRVLSTEEKLRLLGFQAVMYTLPPGAMYALLGDSLPEDQETADAVVQGLEGYMLNKMLTLATGEKTSVDFGGLAPLDAYGLWEFGTSLITTDAGEILASTPSGQLFFGGNPRVTNAFKDAFRWANIVDDYEDPTTFAQVADSFGKMSSGYSNYFKAEYARKYGQKVNSFGGITDPSVSSAEAWATKFGFPTMDETRSYYVKNKLYQDSKAFEEDVKAWYKDVKRHLATKDLNASEFGFASRVSAEAWRVFDANKPKARQVIMQMIKRDISQGDVKLLKATLKATGMGDANDVRALIKSLPNLTEEQRQKYLGTVDFIHDYKEPN